MVDDMAWHDTHLCITYLWARYVFVFVCFLFLCSLLCFCFERGGQRETVVLQYEIEVNGHKG